MSKRPRSAYDQTLGMSFFPRTLDKIRIFAQGELPAEYHSNLGRGADGWCTSFLRVDYAALRARVMEGGSDEEILEWCFAHGRRLNETDLFIWNSFIAKLGWKDRASGRLQEVKTQSGLAHRDDIQTMVDYFEVDEGRKS